MEVDTRNRWILIVVDGIGRDVDAVDPDVDALESEAEVGRAGGGMGIVFVSSSSCSRSCLDCVLSVS